MTALIKALLSEQDKTISTMRVMSIFSLIVGSGVAIYGIYSGKDLGGVAEICAVFIGAAFGGKCVQKFNE